MTDDTAPVAVVTGASRGAGQGIANALAKSGWRVYGTGRSIEESPAWGVGLVVDHRDDAAVGRVFERVHGECGRLDLLVNNAAAVSDHLVDPKPFWQKPIELADVLDTGLRSSYVAAWHAAPLLTAQERGLMVFTSSPGSVCYMHGPAYGAQKAGVDKMVADMAVDFADTTVTVVSLWLGILLTDRLRAAFRDNADALAQFSAQTETPEFAGRVIDALYRDPGSAAVSGHAVIAAEVAERYGITDEGGRRPPSHRNMLGAPREPSSVVVR
ncbi:short-chain dehydrogenase [Mycolicibacterium duvalii]|uniref:Short-chain dehydrogenase n=1 Tax=Mycolicibacterium duvalii TaxID=39688 RepID=A0A7I7JX38_9MYCO|nr:SDR family NAD(P)-dependent oxidoreductase [Mycolicibacterium duvalii]MCV7367064.1 SDR family NAD(P)-dependent oxidoreductase [Mycolicibacterium duvalii]PEG40363.1 short-chain dehydrogenase [Mycolicibacterium duvalii]BBX15811.1 short-chain dehydrogenase [Mycolicibacterium duvalii]